MQVNWILIKDKIMALLFYMAITFEVIAVWNLIEDMYLRVKELLIEKKELCNEKTN